MLWSLLGIKLKSQINQINVRRIYTLIDDAKNCPGLLKIFLTLKKNSNLFCKANFNFSFSAFFDNWLFWEVAFPKILLANWFVKLLVAKNCLFPECKKNRPLQLPWKISPFQLCFRQFPAPAESRPSIFPKQTNCPKKKWKQ